MNRSRNDIMSKTKERERERFVHLSQTVSSILFRQIIVCRIEEKTANRYLLIKTSHFIRTLVNIYGERFCQTISPFVRERETNKSSSNGC